jgi:hypothetical protein
MTDVTREQQLNLMKALLETGRMLQDVAARGGVERGYLSWGWGAVLLENGRVTCKYEGTSYTLDQIPGIIEALEREARDGT